VTLATTRTLMGACMRFLLLDAALSRASNSIVPLPVSAA
jgi:hypothetical protein